MALAPDPSPPASPSRDDLPFAWYVPLVVGVGVYLGLSVMVAVIAAAAGWSELPDRFVLVATLGQDVALIGAAVVVAGRGGSSPLRLLGVRRVAPIRGLVGALMCFGLFFVFLVAWQQVLGVEETDNLAQDLGANDSAFNLVFVAILVCVLAPVAEETFFRGFIYGALRPAFGWMAAATISGVIFGLVHAGSTKAVFLVPLAVLGFLLCWLYRRTGSLLPGMGVHAFNNALALGVTLDWEAWQVIAIAIAAPVVVVSLVALVAKPSRPAAPQQPPPAFMPPVAPELPRL